MTNAHDLPRPIGAQFEKRLAPPHLEPAGLERPPAAPPPKPPTLAEYEPTCTFAPPTTSSEKYLPQGEREMRAPLLGLMGLTAREASHLEGRAESAMRGAEGIGQAWELPPEQIQRIVRAYSGVHGRDRVYVPRAAPIEAGSLARAHEAAEAKAKEMADAGIANDEQRVLLSDLISGRHVQRQIHQNFHRPGPLPNDGPHLSPRDEVRVLAEFAKLGWVRYQPRLGGSHLVVTEAGVAALHGKPVAAAALEPQPASAFPIGALLSTAEWGTPPALQGMTPIGELRGAPLFALRPIVGLTDRLRAGAAGGLAVEPLTTPLAPFNPAHIVDAVHDMANPAKLPGLLALLVRAIESQGTVSDYGPIDPSRFKSDGLPAARALLRSDWKRWLGCQPDARGRGWIVAGSTFAPVPAALLLQWIVRGYLVSVDACIDEAIAALEGVSVDPNAAPPPRIISAPPIRPNKLRPAPPDEGIPQGLVDVAQVRQTIEGLAVAAAVGGPNTWISAGCLLPGAEQTSKSKKGK